MVKYVLVMPPSGYTALPRSIISTLRSRQMQRTPALSCMSMMSTRTISVPARTGAQIDTEPVDQPYGQREYGARDLEGHRWWFATPLNAQR
jgi:hypothetical protein